LPHAVVDEGNCQNWLFSLRGGFPICYSGAP
jgi:hypothetical protein